MRNQTFLGKLFSLKMPWCLHIIKVLFSYTVPCKQVGWVCTGNWEGTQPRPLMLKNQRDTPDHITLCSETKAGGRKRKEGCLELPVCLPK